VGRKRKANLEIEYELERQIKDLKQEVTKLKKLLREKEKTAKVEQQDKPVEKVKKQDKECPECGGKVKTTELPMGDLELCEKACGYRAVKKKKI
jgi:ribosomal protein S27AE